QQIAGRFIFFALLGEDGHVAAQDLEDMIGTDREADVNSATASSAAASVGVGCIPRAGEFLAGEAFAQAVKAGGRLNRGALARRGLFDGGATGVDLGRRRRRRNRWRSARPSRTAGPTAGGAAARGWRGRRTRAQTCTRSFRLAFPFGLALHGGMNNDAL